MSIKITKKDVVWGYTAQMFNIGAGLFILPFILKFLSKDLIDVWYIFQALSIVASFDFGFQPTFSRNVAYIFSGAVRLKAEGIDHDCPLLPQPNYPLLKSMIRTMQRFYRSFSIGVAGVLFIAGSWFVFMKTAFLNDSGIMTAWYIYAGSLVLNLYYSYYYSLLIGRGLVKEYNRILLISKSIYLSLAAIGLIAGFGLIAVAVANLASVVINRVLSVSAFYKGGLYKVIKTTVREEIKLFPVIWYNAKRVGLGGLGGLLTQRVNLLLVSVFLPLGVIGSYGISAQVVSILATVCSLYLNVHLPELYKHRIANNIKEIKRIFGESVFVYVILYITGAAMVLLFGNLILGLLNKITLIPFIPMLLFLIFQFLDSNYNMAITLITTRNEVPYVKALLISGCCTALLSFLLLAFTPLGVLGVILSAGIVQISYNNWKWPLEVCRELNANYVELFKIGLKPLIARIKALISRIKKCS